ncbi:ComEC/Rec2 family competence protein [Hyphomicrobium sp.]|uniref:ComEC/Rec2 family competence protein n=1 Tax=Hyphomicrobium sp. TaxID=82 RepID=UPI002D77FA05|nr:ComEC/Rec2 family competence protein [Hyphomicrobium sp.]HET6389467.1 ComEC/Rec2 family competence protein [Hyphomicrobium sp.]
MSVEAADLETEFAAQPQSGLSRAALLFDAERESFFLWAPVCLGAGIAAYFALPAEPATIMAFAPFVLALIWRLTVRSGTLTAIMITALVLAGAGFAIAKLRVEAVRAPVLTKALHNAEITGTVTMVEAKTPRGQRLTISKPSITGLTAEKTPAVIRVRTMSARSIAAPGDRIRIKANLSPPAKPPLPGGFDYARTAWFDSVGGVGYAFAAPVIEGREDSGTLKEWYRRGIENVRQAIAARIRQALPGETGEIAIALITGERGGITAATNDAFKNSGLFHILSISGLHMVIAAGAVFYSVRLILAAIPLIALTLPIKKIAAVAGILSAIAYLAISGGQFATVRSALMILIIFGAVLLDRPALALRNVALAALLILLVFPESLLDAGFQMSFAAVTALIASHELLMRFVRRQSRPNPIMRIIQFFGEIIASTLIASAAVAPFAAYNFHQSQQYAVLGNMIAIPICNVVVMPSALLAMVLMPFGLEGIGLTPMGWGIEGMVWCANKVGALPGAVGHIPEIPALAFMLMLAGGMWLTLWQTRIRLLGAAFVLLGVLLAPWMPRPDILVGQKGLVAVRDASGKLSALPGKGSKYDLDRWLEYDGDGRSAREAQKGDAFTCDAAGCIARVKGATVAVANHPAAVTDDCLNADVLVINDPKPEECAVPKTVIDVFDRWRNGAYALYVEASDDSPEPNVRLTTVASHRGERPWSVMPERRTPLPKPRILEKPGAAPGTGGGARGASGPATNAQAGLMPETEAEAEPRTLAEEDPGEGAEFATDWPDDAPAGGEAPADAQ